MQRRPTGPGGEKGARGHDGLVRRAAADALAVLRDESPTEYERICVHLAAAPLLVRIGDEALGVTSDGSVVRVRREGPDHRLMEATLDALSVVRLVDGTTTIEQLMESGDLEVRGHPDALLGFLGAARVFARAGARSAALQRIFERFREDVG